MRPRAPYGSMERGFSSTRPLARIEPVCYPELTMKRLFIYILSGLFCAAAHAQTPVPPAAKNAVKCQSGTPQGELACLLPDLKEVEIAVERQLYQLGRKLRSNDRTKGTRASAQLRASQLSWRQYRDQYCVLETLAGSGQNEWSQVRISECAMRLTKDRLESLRDIEATLE